MTDTQNQPADIFKLKPDERACTRCAEGRLYVERISDLKAKHYCDGCDWFEIYSIEPEPMTQSRFEPSAPQPGDYAPTPNTQEAAMPKGTPTGLSKPEYQRWYKAGKPDLEDFKAAGCPMKADWDKLQAQQDQPGDQQADPPAPKPKRKKRGPAQLPAAREPETVPQASSTEQDSLPAKPPRDGSAAKVRVLSIELEGDAGQVLDQLHQLLGTLSR